MTEAIDQYVLETSWSTRITDDIVLEAIQGHIPPEMESTILESIRNINSGKITDKVIYIKFFSIILREKVGRPIQAIATQLGHIAGIKDAAEAFEWGVILVKSCRDAGLYELQKIENEWYVQPNFTLDKKTKHKIDRLQYLPPMQVVPLKWSTNKNGGWLWENKHLILGSKFTKHTHPQAYDVINKLQSIPWKIDTDTYLFEKETNRNLNKKKFLRVINEYLDKSFYFVWRYDSRGRSYCSGYDLSLQSNEYGKALISLKNKEKITNIPNLYIAIANHAGKDKLTWKERVDWVADQVVEEIKWKEPILGRKALRALEDAIQGQPSGYVMSLDATSSGLQIMAAISGCKKTAAMVNCTDSTTRRDVYTEVADLMNQSLTKPVLRSISKQSLMTHFYNSKATPKALLSDEQLKVFYKVIEGLLPGADEVMDTINNCWNSDATAHSWCMPDGHVVYVPVVEATNAVYSDAELGEVSLRYYQQTTSDNFRSLCPNVIHSIDGYIAREMIRRCDFQLSHIHDCFVFSPDHLQEVREMYRIIMAEIAKGDILQDILRQITGDSSLRVLKTSSDLDQDILNSSYMIS